MTKLTIEQAIERAETLLDSGGIFCASQWPYVAEPLRVLLSAYRAQREAVAAVHHVALVIDSAVRFSEGERGQHNVILVKDALAKVRALQGERNG